MSDIVRICNFVCSSLNQPGAENIFAQKFPSRSVLSVENFIPQSSGCATAVEYVRCNDIKLLCATTNFVSNQGPRTDLHSFW